MKSKFLVEKRLDEVTPINYELQKHDGRVYVWLYKAGLEQINRIMIGTLTKTTKRGWTITSNWLSQKPINIFLDRASFTEEDNPKT